RAVAAYPTAAGLARGANLWWEAAHPSHGHWVPLTPRATAALERWWVRDGATAVARDAARFAERHATAGPGSACAAGASPLPRQASVPLQPAAATPPLVAAGSTVPSRAVSVTATRTLQTPSALTPAHVGAWRELPGPLGQLLRAAIALSPEATAARAQSAAA